MTRNDPAVTIRPMTEHDIGASCEVIGLAFADNPSTLVNVRGDRGKARRTMTRVVRLVKLTHPRGRVLVAERGQKILGVLNGVPYPGCRMGPRERFKVAPAMIRAMGVAVVPAAAMMSARARHDPPKSHWHIGPVGVRPEHHGQGIGTALLGSFLSEIDEERTPAFLETDVDKNILLYEKFGFRVLAEQSILGVNTHFMWREPHANTSIPPGP